MSPVPETPGREAARFEAMRYGYRLGWDDHYRGREYRPPALAAPVSPDLGSDADQEAVAALGGPAPLAPVSPEEPTTDGNGG
jgi:hypothetical protein